MDCCQVHRVGIGGQAFGQRLLEPSFEDREGGIWEDVWEAFAFVVEVDGVWDDAHRG